MRILGIDPGYERLGIALVEKNNEEVLLYSECFQTSSKIQFYDRLLLIGKKISDVIERYKPEMVAIETLMFNTNQKTALKVAEARGVILFEVKCRDLPIFEFSPLQIKIALTGYGRSDKKQVTEMVKRLITVNKKDAKDDEYDAIACALTGLASYKNKEK